MADVSDRSLADDWPAADLEAVQCCPVCGHADATHEIGPVRDWAFGVAPGEWHYLRCSRCRSLFLNPRPSPTSIGRAYAAYYTHRGPDPSGVWNTLKHRWKLTRLAARWDRQLAGSWGSPDWAHRWVKRQGQKMSLAYGWDSLAHVPPGRLMDVGCGSGALVRIAASLGWKAEGLELDEVASAAARRAGLTVHTGGYEELRQFPRTFDAMVCSHVIEHVPQPTHMMHLMYESLKPGGVLWLSTPNADSEVLHHFGAAWRGLEAPRHLLLFSQSALIRALRDAGFVVVCENDGMRETVRSSQHIAAIAKDAGYLADLPSGDISPRPEGDDFLKIKATRPS